MMLWSMGQHYSLWKQKSGGHFFKVIYPYLIVHAFPSIVIVSDSQNSVCWKEQKAATGEAVACSLLSTSSAGELWELSVGGPLLFSRPLIRAVSTYLSCKKHFLELMQCHEKDRLLTVQWLNISYSPKRTQTNQTLSLCFWPVFLGSLLTCICIPHFTDVLTAEVSPWKLNRGSQGQKGIHRQQFSVCSRAIGHHPVWL